jgi:hypothetical protein
MGCTACTEPQCLYSRAVPLLPLWAVRPVQSLSACTVELYLYSLYGPYGLYRVSVPVQGWPLPLPLYVCVLGCIMEMRMVMTIMMMMMMMTVTSFFCFNSRKHVFYQFKTFSELHTSCVTFKIIDKFPSFWADNSKIKWKAKISVVWVYQKWCILIDLVKVLLWFQSRFTPCKFTVYLFIYLYFIFHKSELGYNNHEDIEIVILINVSSTKTVHYHTLEIW